MLFIILSEDPFPTIPIGEAFFFAEIVHHALAFDTEGCLEGCGAIIYTRVDHLVVVNQGTCIILKTSMRPLNYDYWFLCLRIRFSRSVVWMCRPSLPICGQWQGQRLQRRRPVSNKLGSTICIPRNVAYDMSVVGRSDSGRRKCTTIACSNRTSKRRRQCAQKGHKELVYKIQK